VTHHEPPPSRRFLELATSPARDLQAEMRRGRAPDRAKLAGQELRGVNTAGGLRLAGADRFVKGFTGDGGYNRRVRRGPRTGRWLPADGPEPKPFAFFSVDAVDPEATDNRYLDALLLDYGPHARSALDPAGRLRDYLVALDADHTLLLGHAFVALGRRRIPATFFVLEPLRPAP